MIDKILIVDDEEFNLDIMREYLEAEDYKVVLAENGAQALVVLEEHPDISVILLDRMMPVMDGMACNAEIKKNPRFKEVPVIMQTAAAAVHQVEEGIKAGVFYYLTKPYRREMMIGIVRSAVLHMHSVREVSEHVKSNLQSFSLKKQESFMIRTLDEAKMLAYTIAQCCEDQDSASLGLSELLINAVEHGNLGISYVEKTALILSGTWKDEVDRRAELPEHKAKKVKLSYVTEGEWLKIHIQDEGKGFDPTRYLDFDPMRAAHPNGRGIAIARMTSFAEMDYLGNGNEVTCTLRLRK